MKKINKSTQYNLIFWALIVLLAAAVILGNGIALILSNRYPLNIDLTANSAYKIGDDTKALLKNLSKPVNIYILSDEQNFSNSSYLIQSRRILKEYPKFSNMVTLEFVNYSADPTFAAGFPKLSLSEGDILVTCGENVKQMKFEDMFNYTYNADGNKIIKSSRLEEAVSSAILNVTSGAGIQAAVLNGNGTADISVFSNVLQSNNFNVTSVNLTTDDFSKYDLAILAAPQVDLSEDVVRKLDNYLYNDGTYGKTILYTAAVDQPALPNLNTFLSEWGIQVDSGAVFETTSYLTYQMQPYYPITLYEDGKYTDMLIDQKTPFLMPLCRPLTILFDMKDKQYTTKLLSFSKTAGVRPADAGKNFTAKDSVRNGPIPALVLASRKTSGTSGEAVQSNLIISGSTAMLDKLAINNTSVANTEYLLDLLRDLSNHEKAIVIQPKSVGGENLGITASQVNLLGILLGGVLPLIILLTGMLTWLRRRFK